MYGIERDEIAELNNLDITEYLKEFHKEEFLIRTNGCMVSTDKEKRQLVIYPKQGDSLSHGFYFGKSDSKKYKDNISVLQIIFDYTFMQAVEVLRNYRDLEQYDKPLEIPKYDMFY